MINKILNSKHYYAVQDSCNKIIQNQITPYNIKDILKDLFYFEYEISGNKESSECFSHQLDVYIDDILEMQNLSQIEKRKDINNVINKNMKELVCLAKNILYKMNSDRQVALDNGYCVKLID